MENIFRCAHHAQNRLAQQACHDRKGNRHPCRQFQSGIDISPHRRIVARAKLLRYRNAESATASCTKSKNQKYDRTACAHCRQRVNPEEFAHYGSIDKRISLLQQIAQQQRKRKLEYQRQCRPCRHFIIFRHRLSQKPKTLQNYYPPQKQRQ